MGTVAETERTLYALSLSLIDACFLYLCTEFKGCAALKLEEFIRSFILSSLVCLVLFFADLNVALMFRYPYVTGSSVVAIKYKDGILMAADMGGQKQAIANATPIPTLHFSLM